MGEGMESRFTANTQENFRCINKIRRRNKKVNVPVIESVPRATTRLSSVTMKSLTSIVKIKKEKCVKEKEFVLFDCLYWVDLPARTSCFKCYF